MHTSEIAEPVYVFVSFDLNNFTALKRENPRWHHVIWAIWGALEDSKHGLEFWKFNGDEFLFCKKVSNMVGIMHLIEKSWDFMLDMETAAQKVLKREGFYVKATAWLASVIECNPSLEENADFDAPNYMFYTHRERTRTPTKDFVGVSIDEGFRMSSVASPENLLVCPEIAMMFHGLSMVLQGSSDSIGDYIDEQKVSRFINSCKKFAGTNQKLLNHRILLFTEKLVLFELRRLKGVWKGSPYPITRFLGFGAKNKNDICALNIIKNRFEESGTSENLYRLMNLISIDEPEFRNISIRT